MEFLYSICILGIFLFCGKLLRANIRILQILFLPSAIISGFLALALGPYGFGLIPDWIISNWTPLPGILINIVFASLFLGVDIPGIKKIWNVGGSQLCFGVVAGMGQYFVALLISALVLIPLFKVPETFGCIVEIGFSGGHGTAAGMKEVFKNLGFDAGGDLSLMSATVGVITAVVVGMILINIAIRKNYCTYLSEKKGIPAYKKKGLIPKPERFSIATATVASEAIEPLTFHFSIISIAIVIGWGMLVVIKSIHSELRAFPLFPLAMLGGLIVQKFSIWSRIDKYYDKNTFDRLLGLALDLLVISAIATIKLDVFLANLWPFVIIMTTGILWMVFCVTCLAPRMFKQFWFERGITEFGMQTGVTAIGLFLLRVVDPLYRTDTAKAFGFKQMIYEPFLGGGFITALAPILVLNLGLWQSIGIAFGIMAVFFVISLLSGWFTFKPDREARD